MPALSQLLKAGGIAALSCLPAVVLLLLTSSIAPSLHANSPPQLAVAASLRTLWPALEQLPPPLPARVSFGASGTLMQQIRRGAPFELFLSADEQQVQKLVDEALTQGPGSVYATGALILVTQRRSALARQPNVSWPALLELARARVDNGQAVLLALPNPAHAPYGRAALQVLENTDAVPLIQQVLGENAAQTLQFVLTGAVDAALVPRSLFNRDVHSDLITGTVDSELYTPVQHRLVLLHGASAQAIAWAERILSPAGQSVLAAAGLEPAR